MDSPSTMESGRKVKDPLEMSAGALLSGLRLLGRRAGARLRRGGYRAQDAPTMSSAQVSAGSDPAGGGGHDCVAHEVPAEAASLGMAEAAAASAAATPLVVGQAAEQDAVVDLRKAYSASSLMSAMAISSIVLRNPALAQNHASPG